MAKLKQLGNYLFIDALSEMRKFNYSFVGEYLMTLPQHLEPYMSQDSMGLVSALKLAVFPGCSAADTAGLQSPADFLLGCISSSSCSTYLSYISSIPSLNSGSSKQLAVDISYLGDILDDLGHPISSDLSSTGCLLRLPEANWSQESGGHNSKIVATVSKLRKINVWVFHHLWFIFCVIFVGDWEFYLHL